MRWQHGGGGGQSCLAARDLTGAVIDIKLPDGNGIDLVAVMRREFPVLPILVCSGHTDDESVDRAYDLGAAYAVKPVVSARIDRFAKGALGQLPRGDDVAEPPRDMSLRAYVPEALVAYASANRLTTRERISWRLLCGACRRRTTALSSTSPRTPTRLMFATCWRRSASDRSRMSVGP